MSPVLQFHYFKIINCFIACYWEQRLTPRLHNETPVSIKLEVAQKDFVYVQSRQKTKPGQSIYLLLVQEELFSCQY